MNEVKERLEEEEEICQGSLKNLWDECKSCLESNCMRFYTTCRHGLSTFTRKVRIREIPRLSSSSTKMVKYQDWPVQSGTQIPLPCVCVCPRLLPPLCHKNCLGWEDLGSSPSEIVPTSSVKVWRGGGGTPLSNHQGMTGNRNAATANPTQLPPLAVLYILWQWTNWQCARRGKQPHSPTAFYKKNQ